MASSIVFIDSRVAGYESIVASLEAGCDWALLQPEQDGVEQIRTKLEGYSGLSSIQIVSHGSAGALHLGAGVLSSANLDAHAAELQAIGAALSVDGDILLYGCDVAQGGAGQAFVERLAQLTGADVAASTDATGAAALGGDWVLERSTGAIEASALADAGLPGLLAAPVAVDTTAYVVEGHVLSGTVYATDAEGDALTYSLVSGAAHGSVTLNANGTYTYTPNASFNGEDSFSFAARDTSLSSNVVKVIINVSPDESLSGTASADTINGGNGSDTIAGLAGNDRIDGGTGNDDVDGGDGNDEIIGNGGDDYLLGGDGNDTILGGGGYIPSIGFEGDSDTIDGGAGDDAIYGEWGDDILHGGLANDTLDGQGDDDVLFGDAGDDNLVGADGDDSLLGGDGTDSLVGGMGKDTLWGEAGTDILYGGDDDDVMHGGADNDTVHGDAGDDVLFGETGDDSLVGEAGRDVLYGAEGNDTLAGGADDDSLVGGAGNDALYGDAGNDRLTDTQGSNDLHGGSGDDRLSASSDVGADKAGLWGDGGNDVLHASGLAQAMLDGGDGDDMLTVDGVTQAVLTGGGGADRFVLTAAQAGQTTTLTDFTIGAGGDLLDYSDLLLNGATGYVIGTNPFETGFLRWRQSGTDAVLDFDADGTAGLVNSYTPLVTLKSVTTANLVAGTNFTTATTNTAPVASGASLKTDEDTPLAGSVAATDADGNALSYSVVTQPKYGTLSFNADGSYLYSPTTNSGALDSFTFKANDGVFDSNVAMVSITVAARNDRPEAVDSSFMIKEDIAYSGQVSATDADGDALTYSVATDPWYGTVSMKADGSYTYTPNANYYGNDHFYFTAKDGSAESALQRVSITVNSVNDVPVAQGASVTVSEDSYFGVSGSLSVTDADRDQLSYVILDKPAHGKATIDADGYYRYIPDANYSGADSFSFKANDGVVDSNTATMSITVTPVNDQPVGAASALASDSLGVSTEEDSAYSGQVSAIDADGDALTYSVATDPWYGTVTMKTDGSYTYTPDANYHGNDHFYFKANDGTTDSAWTRVSITVKSVNDLPVLSDASLVTNEDTIVTGSVSGADPVEKSPLTYRVVTQPVHGKLSFKADGTYSYAPAVNFNGIDSFTVKANDGSDDSKAATVAITVKPVNDVPVAVDSSVSTQEDTAVAGQISASDSVENSPLTYAVVSQPEHGSVRLSSDGRYIYSPVRNYNGTDFFTFKANDGTDDSKAAKVSIKVTSVNDAPTSANVSVGISEDTPLTGKLAFASDPERDPISYAKVTGPAHGSAVVNADGSYTYKPVANYFGGDSFRFSVSDGQASNSYVVNMVVNSANDAPVVSDVVRTMIKDTAVTGTLAGTDADNDALSFRVIGKPMHGSVTVSPNGGYTYTPLAGYNGSDSFTFKANDGTDDSSLGTVAITLNDVPTLTSLGTSVKTTKEDTAVSISFAELIGKGNEADVDGSVKSFVVKAISSGTLKIGSSAATATAWNATTNNAIDGSKFAFWTPAANANGTLNAFTVVAKDNSGAVSATAVQAKVAVTAVRDDLKLTGKDGVNDTLKGDLIDAGSYDWLSGLSGNDTLTGGAGNDTLIGGAGVDKLTGGAGSDVFDFNALNELGLGSGKRDVITDFKSGQDKIDLSSIVDANTAVAGNQDFKWVSQLTTAGGEVRYANGMLYLNTDKDMTAEYEIELTGVTKLVSTDLIL